MNKLLEAHKVKVGALVGNEKERFNERVAICLESNVNELQAEIIALREVEDARRRYFENESRGGNE
jgi:hypothetical protein